MPMCNNKLTNRQQRKNNNIDTTINHQCVMEPCNLKLQISCYLMSLNLNTYSHHLSLLIQSTEVDCCMTPVIQLHHGVPTSNHQLCNLQSTRIRPNGELRMSPLLKLSSEVDLLCLFILLFMADGYCRLQEVRIASHHFGCEFEFFMLSG